MAAEPVFLEHPSSLEHDTRGHPEQAARITAIDRELERLQWLGFSRVASPAVERSVLTAVHPSGYVQWIEEFALRGGGNIDQDTLVSAGSFEAALHGAGGAVRLAEMLVAGEAPCGFSSHRPPGHHARQSGPMGFCLFNNVAVAARFAIDVLGLERVMILDWDVHHGNGTNDIFHASDEVLFVSIHQWPLYPLTGPADDVGSGPGTGFTVNLPVSAGSGDGMFLGLVDGVAVPLARAFEPQLVLISAGYDAHLDDPLADCAVTEAGFAAMTRSMRSVCGELGAPVGCVLEGGYALGALARSVAVTMQALAEPPPAENGAGTSAAADSGGAVVRAARERLSEWWPALA